MQALADIYVHIPRTDELNGILIQLQSFSWSLVGPQVFNTPSTPIMPYSHLLCTVARGTSPPSDQYPILPEVVQDRASTRRIGPCFRLWP